MQLYWLQLNYEDNFFDTFRVKHDSDGDAHAEAVGHIEATITHAQVYFFDESLGTKITLKVINLSFNISKSFT